MSVLSARPYTLIETAKLNGFDPPAWLTTVLGRITDHEINRINGLLPVSGLPASAIGLISINGTQSSGRHNSKLRPR